MISVVGAAIVRDGLLERAPRQRPPTHRRRTTPVRLRCRHTPGDPGWALRRARCRNRTPTRHPTDSQGTSCQGSRLYLPRLQPAGRRLRRPPHHALATRWRHLPGQPVPTLQAPPQPPRTQPPTIRRAAMENPDQRRRNPRGNPTQTRRPTPTTTTTPTIPTTDLLRSGRVKKWSRDTQPETRFRALPRHAGMTYGSAFGMRVFRAQ